MAAETKKPDLRVDIEAVAIWEPVGTVADKKNGKTKRVVAGLSVQSWDFRPRRDSEEPLEILITETPQDYVMEDGSVVALGTHREWRVFAHYFETTDFPSADGSPRPKHYFEAKLSKELKERLRESPEDILAKSDLYDGELPPPKGGAQ